MAPLHRVKMEQVDAQGRVVNSSERYVERVVMSMPPELERRLAKIEARLLALEQRGTPPAGPIVEGADHRPADDPAVLDALMARVAALEARPEPPPRRRDESANALPRDPRVAELAGNVQDGFARFDTALAAMRASLDMMGDHGHRLHKIEAAIAAFAAMNVARLEEDARAASAALPDEVIKQQAAQ